MASLMDRLFLLSLLLFFNISPSSTRTLPTPKTLALPVTKDKCSNQYIIQINQRTPSVPVKLTVDLGGRFMWIDCEEGYVSSSYRHATCRSSICSLANAAFCSSEIDIPDGCSSTKKPGCYKNSCFIFPQNRIISTGGTGDVGQDNVSIQFYNKKHQSNIISLPDFPFVCGRTRFLDSLADGVTGIAGFGRENISLPYFLSKSIGISKKFSICLSSSKTNGQIFFGEAPPNNHLIYTPLIVNPRDDLVIIDESADYYIQVKSIRVDGEEIKFNKKLLSIDKKGNGGTMISTVQPYTVLHKSIYKALIKVFTSKAKYSTTDSPKPVPFTACFSSYETGIEASNNMPVIDLELENQQGKQVHWRIAATNLMVAVGIDTMCLGIVEGGSHSRASIVIGGHQLEENLLQFDLVNSRLGFSSSLHARNTSCSNINF